jgi:purine-binding chemotaxis protein CheW
MKQETLELLKRRAIEMGRETDQDTSGRHFVNVISFSLAGENYGIESEFVDEVFQLKEFAPLPGVPSHILGVVNVRGQILAVIDLKVFFNLPFKGIGELDKVIILRNAQMEFGILADVVYGTQSIDIEEIMAVPQTVAGIGGSYTKGVTKEHLIILNGEALLMDKGLVINEE